MLGAAGPVFPEAGVILSRSRDRFVDERFNERHQRLVARHDARIGVQRLETQHHLAVDVVLRLVVRGVADAYGPSPTVALPVLELQLDKIPLSSDSVDRLQRSAVSNVAQEPDEML